MGQSRSERRRDPLALPCAGRRAHQERVHGVGTRQIRSAPPCVRRHEPDSAALAIAAGRHSADLRAAGRRLRDYTGDGPISYWNSYVGVGQMGGHGTFIDPRIGLVIRQTPDRVTPKLDDLLAYQLSLTRRSLRAAASIDRPPIAAAAVPQRGGMRVMSSGTVVDRRDERSQTRRAAAARPERLGTEREYATRSATGRYRTTPLRALWQHPPYFHDGSAPDLPAVVEHYDERSG